MFENCCILIQASRTFAPRVPLTIICHWLHNGTAPYKRQSINWIGDEPVHWRVYASQGRKELIAQALYISKLLRNYQLDVLCHALKAKRCHHADAKFAPMKNLFASRQPAGFRMLGLSHDDVIKWKHFARYSVFVRGIRWPPVNSPYKDRVTRSFDVFFDLHLSKRLSKQSWGWWFETLSRPLWRQCNALFSVIAGSTPPVSAAHAAVSQFAVIVIGIVLVAASANSDWSRMQKINSFPPGNVVAISQTTFSSVFSWMKSFVFWLNFHWSLFIRV